MTYLLSFILNPVYCDAPEPWQIGFQDGASPTFEGITELHNAIFFYLVVILVGVCWVLGSIVANYSSSKASIVHKYANHGTLIELVWTITPAFILIAIAFPSFKLLYLMDSPKEGFELVLLATTFPVFVGRGKITPNISCKAIVPLGLRGSTFRCGRLSNSTEASTLFPRKIVSQLVGHLLGDGSLAMTHTSNKPYFVFTQTLLRFDYIWSVYNTFSHYCNSFPILNFSKRKGNVYPFLQVLTRSYTFLLSLYHVFYQEVNGKMVKVIDYNLLPYLDDIALAYWAMDDGAKVTRGSGFYLHTKGFTFSQVYKLVAMLHYQFNLVCSVQSHKGQPVICIRAQSMDLFRSIVEPHFHPQLVYKLTFK